MIDIMMSASCARLPFWGRAAGIAKSQLSDCTGEGACCYYKRFLDFVNLAPICATALRVFSFHYSLPAPQLSLFFP